MGNIVEYFFNVLIEVKKCRIEKTQNQILIRPRLESAYYEPVIVIKSLEELELSLMEYLNICKNFDKNYGKNIRGDYYYFLYNLISNMTAGDANDLVRYIKKRINFFRCDKFEDFKEETLIFKTRDAEYFAKRTLSYDGQETPYALSFSMKINEDFYELPNISYAIDENNICYIYAIQFGRHRISNVQSESFKQEINKINKGVHKYRNISPSFVLVFRLFLDLLKEKNIKRIIIPDFLCFRYKNYFRGHTCAQSDAILSRIINQFSLLCRRMEYQYPFFNITSYPNELDSNTHITLNDESYIKILSNK